MFRGQTWPESESSAREQGCKLNETMIYTLFDNIPQSYQPYIFFKHSREDKCGGFDCSLGYNIQNLRVMSEPLASALTAQIDFFPGALDIILLVVALVSTLSTSSSMQFPC